jgi:hypothetical protein
MGVRYPRISNYSTFHTGGSTDSNANVLLAGVELFGLELASHAANTDV